VASTSNNHEIEVALNKEKIKTMASDDKLNILVDIAFANHMSISRLNSILIGDGRTEGFCEMVNTTRKSITWIWRVFCGVSGAFFASLIYLLTKG